MFARVYTFSAHLFWYQVNFLRVVRFIKCVTLLNLFDIRKRWWEKYCYNRNSLTTFEVTITSILFTRFRDWSSFAQNSTDVCESLPTGYICCKLRKKYHKIEFKFGCSIEQFVFLSVPFMSMLLMTFVHIILDILDRSLINVIWIMR